jgi:hypothetical protein
VKPILFWGFLLIGQLAFGQVVPLGLNQAENRAVATSSELSLKRSEATKPPNTGAHARITVLARKFDLHPCKER